MTAMVDDRKRLMEHNFKLGVSYQDISIALFKNHNIVISPRHVRRLLSRLNRNGSYRDLEDIIDFI